MPDIEECKKWIADTKSFLGITHPVEKGRLTDRNDEIAKILHELETMKTNVFSDLKDEYESIATRAFNISKGASSIPEKDILAISGELRILKKKVRLAVAVKQGVKDPKVQQELLRATEHEPFYRDKRERIEAAIKTLNGLAGARQRVKIWQNMLNKAESFEPDYQRALREITTYGDLSVGGENETLLNDIAEAKQRAVTFEEQAGSKKFQVALKAARKTVNEYEEVASIGDADGVRTANEKINGAVKLLDQDEPDEKAAIEILEGIVDDLGPQTDKLKDASTKLEKIVPAVSQKIRDLIDAAPSDRITEVVAKHRTLRALWETQQLDGVDEWDQLNIDTQKLLDQWEQHYTKWQEYENEIDEKSDVIVPASKIKELSVAANYLQSLIEKTIRTELLPKHKFDEACKIFEDNEIGASLIELEKNSKDPGKAKFKNKEMEARIKIERGRDLLQREIEKVDSEIEKLDTAEGDTSPFEKMKQNVVNAWAEGASKIDPDQADTGISQLLQAGTIECANIIQKVKDVLGNPKSLQTSKDDKTNAGAMEQFEEHRKAAQTGSRKLAAYGLPDDHTVMSSKPKPADMKVEFENLLKKAAQGDYAFEDMEKLAAAYEKKLEAIDKSLQQIRDTAAENAKKFKEKIAAAEKDNKNGKKFYTALREQTDDGLGRTRSIVYALIESGAEDLDKLVKMKLPDAKAYDKVAYELKTLGDWIDSKDLQEYKPELQKVFKARFKEEISKQVYDQSPDEAEKDIKAMMLEVKAEADDAAKLKKKRNELRKKAKARAKEIKDLEKTAPTLYKSLSARLTKVEKSDKTDVKDAELELRTVEILIKSARSSDDQRNKMDDKAKIDEFEAKRQKVAFEGSLMMFERGISTDADRLYLSLPESERNKDVYKQIAQVLEQAQKLAGKKDYVAANDSLARAVGLAKYFLDNPTDRITSSRKELTRLKGEFQGAVSDYLKQLSVLRGELARIKKEEDVDTDKAVKALDPLYSLFNAKVFDPSIEVLKTPAENAEELKTHRTYKELALKNTRRYEKLMASHKLLMHVIGNPIKEVKINRLRTAVRGLTRAVLAS